MRRDGFPVVWAADDPAAESVVGQVSVVRDRVMLNGMSRGRRVARCHFDVSDVEALIVTRRVNPVLHLRLRERGWLRVTGFSTIVVFQLAEVLAQLTST